MEGYVKLWRKSLESPIWQNHNLWRFWEWCLMKATFKPRVGKVGFQDVQLEPGQFIFGRLTASKETGLSEQTIRTSIDSLRSSQNLTIKSTNKYSIISIVKWAEYQEEVTSKVTNKQPATNQQLTTDKKGKKDKKEKKGIYGQFQNVFLTLDEYGKFQEKANSRAGTLIESLSEYKASHGKKYDSDYAALLGFDRRDREKQPKENPIKKRRIL